MVSTAVLVHGAWHGAWCFERVIPLLAAAGIPALALDLPGHGANERPLGDLHTDAASVYATLDDIAGRTDDGVVLLGHSYGGAVITEAGNHPAVRHLVYLCALALDAGETCATAASEEAKSLSHEGRPNLGAAFVAHDDGTITLRPEGALACLYNDCDAATGSWAVSRLGPQPGVTLAQQPKSVAWRERPSTYVVCTRDMAIHPGLQRILGRRASRCVEWDTDHSPFLSRPELVAQLLSDLAQAVA